MHVMQLTVIVVMHISPKISSAALHEVMFADSAHGTTSQCKYQMQSHATF
jgi:hypothetical protein